MPDQPPSHRRRALTRPAQGRDLFFRRLPIPPGLSTTTASIRAPPIRLPLASNSTSDPPCCAVSCALVLGFFLLPGKTEPQYGQTTFALFPVAFVALSSVNPGRGSSLPSPRAIRNRT